MFKNVAQNVLKLALNRHFTSLTIECYASRWRRLMLCIRHWYALSKIYFHLVGVLFFIISFYSEEGSWSQQRRIILEICGIHCLWNIYYRILSIPHNMFGGIDIMWTSTSIICSTHQLACWNSPTHNYDNGVTGDNSKQYFLIDTFSSLLWKFYFYIDLFSVHND